MSEEFYFFWKHRLSQWHKCDFVIEGMRYNCAEQYMMAGKAKLFNDLRAHGWIMGSTDPHVHQKVGREVQNFDLQIWNLNARDIVYKGNLARFTQVADQKELLLSTGEKTLVEASPYDRIWGIGLAATDPRAQDKKTWRGSNWLGEVLTRVRNDIRIQGL